jgi:hypothetical protein
MFVIHHSRTLVAHNKRVKESEKYDGPQKCRAIPPCHEVALMILNEHYVAKPVSYVEMSPS